MLRDTLICRKGEGLKNPVIHSMRNFKILLETQIVVKGIFMEGVFCDPSWLDISSTNILAMLTRAQTKLDCLSLISHHPTPNACLSLLCTAFKTLLAVAIRTDVTFSRAEATKDYIECPFQY